MSALHAVMCAVTQINSSCACSWMALQYYVEYRNMLVHAGARARPTAATDLPWAGSEQQIQQLKDRIAAMWTSSDSCMYTGLATVDFGRAFGQPGGLKTSEYLLLEGPISKYILNGSMHSDQ